VAAAAVGVAEAAAMQAGQRSVEAEERGRRVGLVEGEAERGRLMQRVGVVCGLVGEGDVHFWP
jgi:hypothetical protein